MGKKAPRRNGYFFFMMDFKKRERYHASWNEISSLASSAWQKLPQEEKDRYKKRADDYNKSEERNQGGFSGGYQKKKKNPPPSPNRALTIKEAKQRAEKQFIQNMIDRMTINELVDHVFHLIHVNVFCKTTDNDFVPAEIAISKFSLRNGVTDVFHRILTPGETPLGYSYEIKTHSEKTHRIPLEFAKGAKGYLGVYNGITDFLRANDNPDIIPPLYTMFDEPFHNCSMSAVKFSLKRIWETSPMYCDDEDGSLDEDELYEKTFRVLSLPILFFHLKNKCASTLDDDAVAFENTSEANIALLNDRYEFNEELACQFHKEIDNVRYCSQSYTVRWAQVIREQCLKNLESDDEEEEEEEEELVNDEVVRIGQEREQAIKEEKSNVTIKEEKNNSHQKTYTVEIKKEKDGSWVKKEKYEKDDARVKQKKDGIQVKQEKDETRLKNYPLKDEFMIKEEKDKEVKEEDDVQINYEKDGFSSRPIKVERDSESRSGEEKDDRYRSNENKHVKEEHPRSSENYTPVRVKIEKYDPGYEAVLKNETLDIPFDNFYVKSERVDNTQPKRERSDIPVDVKIERSDCQNLGPSDSRADIDSILKSEHVDIPFDIKTEHYSHSTEETLHDRESSQSSSVRVKAERSRWDMKTPQSDDFPLPIPIKTEFLSKTEPSCDDVPNDFPLPKPIKVEKNSHQNYFPMPIVIKTEKEDFPAPKKIKIENDIQIKKEPCSKDSESNERLDDFSLPINVKVEGTVTEEPSSSAQKPSKSHKRIRDLVDLVEESVVPKCNPQIVKMEQGSDAESLSDYSFGHVRIKNEPEDSYSVHGMKHEEYFIENSDIGNDEVRFREPSIKEETNTIKTECEIKKEK